MARGTVTSTSLTPLLSSPFSINLASVIRKTSTATVMATTIKIIDSHLHVWASPQEAVDKFPYLSGQEPSLRGNFDFLFDCKEEAGVDGALIVQPISHKFDHSYVTSDLKKGKRTRF